MKDVVDIKKWMELSIPRTMSTAWAEEAPHYPPPTPGCLGPGPESRYRHPQPRDGDIQQQRAGGYEDEGGLGRSSRLRDGLPPCWGEESPASLRGHPWRHRAQWKRGSAVRIRRLVKNLELWITLLSGIRRDDMYEADEDPLLRDSWCSSESVSAICLVWKVITTLVSGGRLRWWWRRMEGRRDGIKFCNTMILSALEINNY